MPETKSSRFKILSRVIGLLVFIVIMFILNQYNFNNTTVTEIIGFLNENFLFIIIMSIILLIADMFYAIIIPFSLPAPIFGAVGSLFVVTFIFRIFNLLGKILQEDAFINMSWLRWIIYPLVFIIVLVSGYISILFNTVSRASQTQQKKEKIINITPKRHKTWRDVGDELKDTTNDPIIRQEKALIRNLKNKCDYTTFSIT